MKPLLDTVLFGKVLSELPKMLMVTGIPLVCTKRLVLAVPPSPPSHCDICPGSPYRVIHKRKRYTCSGDREKGNFQSHQKCGALDDLSTIGKLEKESLFLYSSPTPLVSTAKILNCVRLLEIFCLAFEDIKYMLFSQTRIIMLGTKHLVSSLQQKQDVIRESGPFQEYIFLDMYQGHVDSVTHRSSVPLSCLQMCVAAYIIHK